MGIRLNSRWIRGRISTTLHSGRDGNSVFRVEFVAEVEETAGPPLRYPGFLWRFAALTNFMRFSLKKTAHSVLSDVA
jgi:hypothetical protein